jgi:hypothetical protein
MYELEAQGPQRCTDPPFRVKGPFNAAHSVTYQALPPRKDDGD